MITLEPKKNRVDSPSLSSMAEWNVAQNVVERCFIYIPLTRQGFEVGRRVVFRSGTASRSRRALCDASRCSTGSTSSRWTKATFLRPCCKSWQKSNSQHRRHMSDGLGPVRNSREAACRIWGMGALCRTRIFGTGICLRHSSRAPFSSGFPSALKQFVA